MFSSFFLLVNVRCLPSPPPPPPPSPLNPWIWPWCDASVRRFASEVMFSIFEDVWSWQPRRGRVVLQLMLFRSCKHYQSPSITSNYVYLSLNKNILVSFQQNATFPNFKFKRFFPPNIGVKFASVQEFSRIINPCFASNRRIVPGFAFFLYDFPHSAILRQRNIFSIIFQVVFNIHNSFAFCRHFKERVR